MLPCSLPAPHPVCWIQIVHEGNYITGVWWGCPIGDLISTPVPIFSVIWKCKLTKPVAATCTSCSLAKLKGRVCTAIHLPCHVVNLLYSWQVQGNGGSTDVKVLVGVLPKACCHLQVVLSLLHYSAGYGYKVWGCKSSVLKHWGVSEFIECKCLLKDCLLKVSTCKSQRRFISARVQA